MSRPLAQSEAIARLEAANSVIATCALLIGAQRETMERFLKEARDMDNFGHIVDPTLYRSSERRAVSAALEPIYQAALAFLAAYETRTAKTGEGEA